MHEREFFILYGSYGVFLLLTAFIFLRIYWKRRVNLIARENRERAAATNDGNVLPVYTISDNVQEARSDRLPSYFEIFVVDNPPDYKEAIKGKMIE